MLARKAVKIFDFPLALCCFLDLRKKLTKFDFKFTLDLVCFIRRNFTVCVVRFTYSTDLAYVKRLNDLEATHIERIKMLVKRPNQFIRKTNRQLRLVFRIMFLVINARR